MKKYLLSIVFLGILALTAFPFSSFAEYDSSGDITLSVNLLEDTVEPSGETGEITFETQEGAHDLLTDSTGLEVDHSYVWIEINGVKILGVDPPKPCY